MLRAAHVSTSTARWAVAPYVKLMKPRVISLLLVTTLAGMLIASDDVPSPWLVFWTLLGGFLSAGGANVINCYLDRDIDGLMARTTKRPIPSGEVSPEHALAFGTGISLLSL